MPTTLSANWISRTASLFNLVSGVAEPSTPGQASIASYASPMLFNDHKITAIMKTPAADDVALLYVRANTSNQVILAANNNAAWRVYTCDGSYTQLMANRVSRAVSPDALSWVDADTLTFEAAGNCYNVYKNGAYLFRWTDEGGVYAPNVNQSHHECSIGYLSNTLGGGFDRVDMDDLYIWPSTVGTDGSGALSATTITSTPVGLSGAGTLSATAVRNFTPITDTNINKSNVAVPAGTFGCWVTLIGGGGAGGTAGSLANAATWQYGGAGGGGGGRINRFFIDRSLLGATYTVTRGLGAASANGTNSVFSSGGKSLTAGGGLKGGDGSTAGYSTLGGGGTYSTTGYSGITGEVGGQGNGGQYGNGSGDNTTDSGAGGGWGAYAQTAGGGTSYASGPATGGNSSTRAGGAGGGAANNGTTPTAAVAPNGGAGGGGGGSYAVGTPGSGGAGGDFGGGGGAQGAGISGTLVSAKGGNGLTRVEWV